MLLPSAAHLFTLAEPQHGYFTAAQATASGFNAVRLPVMASRGQIERVSRGVYRLVHYPVSQFADYIEAMLWPHDEIGVISHESALRFHELSDVNPAKIHITLPTSYRVRRDIPKILKIHHADLSTREFETLNGVMVTTAVQSIVDCHEAHLSSALITQAIEDGRDNGQLRVAEARALAKRLDMKIAPHRPVYIGNQWRDQNGMRNPNRKGS